MERTLSYIGLCKKSGNLICGTEMVTEAIRAGKIKAAFTASDASANTKKRISDGCSYRNIPYSSLPFSCDQIGKATGRAGGIASVGILDEGFAAMIIKSLDTTTKTTAEFI